MRMLIPLAIAALAALVAFPAQAEAQSDRPDDQAWVDDCPPDMLCAAGSGPEEPIAYGNDTCIECSGVADPSDQPRTCMDGADGGEACDDDVQYFGPGPADTGDGTPEPATEDASDDVATQKDAPAVAAVLLLAGMLGLVLVLRRR